MTVWNILRIPGSLILIIDVFSTIDIFICTGTVNESEVIGERCFSLCGKSGRGKKCYPQKARQNKTEKTCSTHYAVPPVKCEFAMKYRKYILSHFSGEIWVIAPGVGDLIADFAHPCAQAGITLCGLFARADLAVVKEILISYL